MFSSNWAARLALALACTGFGVAHADTSVFINELHYDNASTDSGEAIEVAAPAGTDLTGWKIVLYNGTSAPTAALTYGTATTLSGVVPAQCGQYGTLVVTYATDGIQNGANDGIALVNASGTVVQFLSYEGVITAGNGAAMGLTSTDIGVSENGTQAATMSLQLSGTGTLYGDFSWHADSTSSFGACNTGQTFGAPPDIAPAVTSTVPANSATGVALNANITLNFSEPVSVTNTAFDLICANSGSHSVAIAGTGTAYTLDPDADFTFGEHCTVTVEADQVTDLDGGSDPMSQDAVFGFDTAAGDVPPTVLSTAPTTGALNYPRGANLQVTFSEPVALDAGWFTISCNVSGTHSAIYTGTTAIYSVNPDSDFAALEHCTWTILADHVHDLDGSIDAMAVNRVVTFDTGADSSDYYTGVDTSSGPALEAWLHNRIKDHVAYGYTSLGPGQTSNSWDILRAADEDPMNTANVIDIYKNVSYPKNSTSLNREHTWPNSYGFNDLTTNNGHPYPPYTDCHMLYMADSSYNQSRSNNVYGNCAGTGTCVEKTTAVTNGLGGLGHSNFRSPTVWEVWDHRKGDAARAILYMAVRYDGGTNALGQPEPDLQLTDNLTQVAVTPSGATVASAYMGKLTDLLQWNDLDPPDEAERLRDEVVYSYQQNRNPFIDHPEWARCVFTNTSCPVQSDSIFADGFEGPQG
jgi:endonuclease I